MTTPGEAPEGELDESEWFGSDALVAPPDAVRLDTSEPSQAPVDDTDAPRERGGLDWTRVVVLALAMAFLGGSVGYFVGTDRPPGESSVDVGFLRDMIDHHEQAVLMARMTLWKDDIDPTTASFAEEVVLNQQREIGIMDTYLSSWGRIRGDLDRSAMAWMGMDSTPAAMPGMQSEDALAELESANGSEADRLFFTMMRDHHLGGVHMAQYAADRAKDSGVKDLASRIARYQELESQEYTGAMRRLGLES